MLTTALAFGLASVYLWFLLAHASISDHGPVHWLRENESWPGELLRCPWCCGFWLSGLLLLACGIYDPVTHLATATVVGVVGDFVA